MVTSGGYATIRGRDHGPGSRGESRSVLFRRFARIGTRGRSTGVGLHLVRSIARAHGGDATYEPAEGGGACFTITLPLSGSGSGAGVGGGALGEPAAGEGEGRPTAGRQAGRGVAVAG